MSWQKITDLNKEAAYKDVREKALALRAAGGVNLIRHDADIVASQVTSGDNTYDVTLKRQGPDLHGISQWDCNCKWAQHAFSLDGKLRKYRERMCSHAWATFFEIQSRENRKRPDGTPAPTV